MQFKPCLQCTVYSVLYTFYITPCTVYSLQSTVYHIPRTIYSVQYTVYNIQCKIYSVQYTVYRTQCPLLCSPAQITGISLVMLDTKLQHTILYCTSVLYCTVLYCTLLYCTVPLYCTVLHCTVLYCRHGKRQLFHTNMVWAKIFYPKKCVNNDKSNSRQNSVKGPKDLNSAKKSQTVT